MLNPLHSRLDKNAFWLRTTDRDDNVVALFGAKVFHTDDFMALVRSERLWFDRSPDHTIDPRTRALPAFEAFGGIVSHGAGVWTARSFRTRGLAAFLSSYARALLVRDYGIDWHTLTTVKEYLPGFTRTFGYQFALLYDGWCPVIGAETEFYMGRMTQAQIVEHLRAPALLIDWVDVPAPAATAR
jgi:hypothetical protein